MVEHEQANEIELNLIKVAQKVFHFGSNLPKMYQNYPEHSTPKEKMLRIVYVTFFGRFEPK